MRRVIIAAIFLIILVFD